VVAQINARIEEKQEAFLQCWYSDEAQARIREAAKKS